MFSVGLLALRADGGDMPNQARAHRHEPLPDAGTISIRLRELELAIGSLADLVVVVDQSAYVVECNGASQHVWGLNPADVLGLPIPTSSGRIELISRDGNTAPPGSEPTVRALASHRTERVSTLGLRRPDGSVTWARVVAIPVVDAEGATRVLSVWTDVTATIEHETDLVRMNREVERRVGERTTELEGTVAELESTIADLEAAIADVGAFSYSVSHDLRTPVRTIGALAESLLDEIGEQGSPAARDLVYRIHRAALRMDTLIDALLQLSVAAHAELRRVPMDISAMAREGIQRLVDRSPDRKIEWAVADGMLGFGDQRLVDIVLDNLLGNAWKFTALVDNPHVEVGVRQPDGPEHDRVFYVRDNGIGFDMHHADDLFTPFRRLDSAREFDGTGVGLAIVHRIVTRHGGRVWAESTPGNGATLFFTLPDAA